MDQELMQKNLTCKSLGEAQKNMFWFSLTLIVVNLLFLSLARCSISTVDNRESSHSCRNG